MLLSIFIKSRARIIRLWGLDIITVILGILFPWIVGLAIDGLANGLIFWFVVLIFLEILYLIVKTISKQKDTKLYSKILEVECYQYYKRAVSIETDDTIIAARVQLIEDFTEFLQIQLPNMIFTILGIAISIFYLFKEATWLIACLAIIISILTVIITYKWQCRIAENNELKKDEAEHQQEILVERNLSKYRAYLVRIFMFDVDSSNTEAKSYCVSAIIQICLLIGAIYMLIYESKTTIGVIYATITYIYMLNDEVLNIPEYIVSCKNLVGSARRIIE